MVNRNLIRGLDLKQEEWEEELAQAMGGTATEEIDWGGGELAVYGNGEALVGGALAAPAILPGNLFAKANSDTLRIGLIGCGGRGSGAASQALSADNNVALVAMGDAFEDRLQSGLKNLRTSHAEKVTVTPEKCFVGLDAYEKVIDCGVDVVILATPPGFRPAHLKAAVAAGKHVFCEKPMATNTADAREMERLADALPIERAASRWIVSTDPQEVVERVRAYVDLGFDHLVFHAPGADQARFLKLFSERVVPLLRSEFA